MSVVSMLPVRTCPAWCTDHTGFDDGSEDWHKSQEFEVGGYTFYVSSGTLSGEAEIFDVSGPALSDGVSLDAAEAFARAILAAVKEARA